MNTLMWIGFAVFVLLVLIFGGKRKGGGPDHMDGNDGDMD